MKKITQPARPNRKSRRLFPKGVTHSRIASFPRAFLTLALLAALLCFAWCKNDNNGGGGANNTPACETPYLCSNGTPLSACAETADSESCANCDSRYRLNLDTPPGCSLCTFSSQTLFSAEMIVGHLTERPGSLTTEHRGYYPDLGDIGSLSPDTFPQGSISIPALWWQQSTLVDSGTVTVDIILMSLSKDPRDVLELPLTYQWETYWLGS